MILSIFLTILLGAANGYLGLKVGITISASIPAAIIAMGLFRFVKNTNVLQINIVQTAASAGEALTAGVAFTLPALIILGAFPHFDYWTSAGVAAIGGIFGVLFSVPLRRILLKDRSLHFPEGTAIANVLRASADKSMGLTELVYGALASAMISFSQIGLKILSGGFTIWRNVGTTVFGFGLGFSPTLIGAGYIIGINTGMAILAGIVVGWIVILPIIGHLHSGFYTGSAAEIAGQLWSQNIRFVGVGVLLIGGVWSLLKLLKPITHEVKHALAQRREAGDTKVTMAQIPRTERDIPFYYVTRGGLLLALPLFGLFLYFAHVFLADYGWGLQIILSAMVLVFFMVVGFLVSAILAYLAGLIGTSASPMSAFALLTLMLAAFMLLPYAHHTHGTGFMGVITLAIMVTVVITAAAAISNDTMQDLKAGQYVGATPWKQQVMLMVGVCVAALTIPAVLELLFQAYGIGGVFPRPGMDPNDMLAAPQATIMATVAKAIFAHTVPWNMLFVGFGVGAASIVTDETAKRRGQSFPVIGVGLGIYLPFAASVPLLLGGIASYCVNRGLKRKAVNDPELIERCQQKGLILACGIVAGAAVMGVLLAIPFALKGSANVLAIVGPGAAPYTIAGSIVVTLGLMLALYRVVTRCASNG